MIDHMLVNLKKYYEGKFRCYIGMNIKAPKSSLPAYYMADSPVDGADMLPSTAKPSLTPAELENKEVLAQRLNGLDDFYLLIQPAGYYSYINCWIKLSDLVKNGGVSSSLLTHVYHAFILARKELSMAIIKMKYQLQDWYPGKTQNYIGKEITMTSDVANYPYEMFLSGDFSGVPAHDSQPTTGTVVAQFNTKKEIYICIGTHYDSDIFWYNVADVKIQNGGVISLLTQLYQGFQCVFTSRKAVRAWL